MPGSPIVDRRPCAPIVWRNPRPPAESETPRFDRLRLKPGAIFKRLKKRKAMCLALPQPQASSGQASRRKEPWHFMVAQNRFRKW